MTKNQVIGKTGPNPNHTGVQSMDHTISGSFFNHIRENSAPSKFRFDLMI